MSDTRTPDEIESDIQKNRDGLQNTLVALQETFTPESLFRSVSDNVTRHGGDFGSSVSRAARDNPLALAVTGVGLGWLIFGRGPSTERIGATADRARDPNLTLGGERKTAYGEGAEAHIGPSGPVPKGDAPNWTDDESRGPSMGQRVRAGWHNTQSRVGSGAGQVRHRSSEMAQRLSSGTEHMSADARERIISARERAIHAGERTNRGARQGADRAVDFFDEHPLVAGALAFAVGAAIAGSLPRSRTEDSYFGEESDRLYDEAERVFAEERDKAERVAGAAMEEARRPGDEADRSQQNAADAAVDRTEDAAQRVAHAAERQAEKEDFGSPRG